MSKTNSENFLIFCSFCGRYSDFVKKLVAGVTHGGKVAYIRKHCAELVYKIVKEGESSE